MKTSISTRPNIETWPAGQTPPASGTAHDSCRKCTPHGIMKTVSMSNTMNSIATR